MPLLGWWKYAICLSKFWIFWLLIVHESAGNVEKAKLKSTLHRSSSLFVSGNPQSKMEAIRIVVDKALTLRVKIDFEATVKPMVMTLRKRSPNFNELATKYLRAWKENTRRDAQERGAR